MGAQPHGPVAELADAADLKSASSDAKCEKQQEDARDSGKPTAVATATGVDLPPSDTRLARIVEAWPDMPEGVRAAIVAMVDAVTPHKPEQG